MTIPGVKREAGAGKPRMSREALTALIFLVLITVFLNADMNLLYPNAVFIEKDLGINDAQLGAVSSAFIIIGAILGFLTLKDQMSEVVFGLGRGDSAGGGAHGPAATALARSWADGCELAGQQLRLGRPHLWPRLYPPRGHRLVDGRRPCPGRRTPSTTP